MVQKRKIDIDDKSEFEYLIKSIEECSKHARNLMFFLIGSSVYVLITAFSSENSKSLKLPALNVDVSTTDFFLISPIIILILYSYMQIYVSELNNRIELFDNIDFKLIYYKNKRIILYPWILIFSKKTKHSSEKEIYGVNYKYLIANFLIWYLSPIILFTLWSRFVGKEEEVSIVPCFCFIFSLTVLLTKFENKKIIGIFNIILAASLLIITVASVPSYREFWALEELWMFVINHSDDAMKGFSVFLYVVFLSWFIGNVVDGFVSSTLSNELRERMINWIISIWLHPKISSNRIATFIVQSVEEKGRPFTLIFTILGIFAGAVVAASSIGSQSRIFDVLNFYFM